MFTKVFWKDAAERLVTVAAVTALGLFTSAQSGVGHVDFKADAVVVLTAVVGTLVKVLVAAGKTNTISPASFVTDKD